ncbi:hypothetical protein HMPREF1548_03542 [Clostridium sp. KLE 1755]|nr:hypothetical protein HMPREF1548_03542 [Clostridium sp. KLE 1755]
MTNRPAFLPEIQKKHSPCHNGQRLCMFYGNCVKILCIKPRGSGRPGCHSIIFLPGYHFYSL